ncbi:TIGR04222 domain-containing membrane protein [Actinomadura gamaensis]|uniref:TIGR04222 domain-containing membrane protein n=1 Tax=Actinomadura gamaensis TaxID=1763541 RepID=A0ABV9U009_9ACTN
MPGVRGSATLTSTRDSADRNGSTPIEADRNGSARVAAGGVMDVYETAYLCGGGERVALVALVRLVKDGRVTIAPARHRVAAVRPDPGPSDAADDPVATAALEALPSTGAALGRVRSRLARSDAVSDVRKSLVEQRLWRGRFATRRGRRVRADLDPDSAPGWVALLGTPGIADERLRRIFETPDPDLSGARWFRRHPLVRGRPDYDGPSGVPFDPSYGSGSDAGTWGGGAGGHGGGGSW